MAYYSEQSMGPVRLDLEQALLSWPGVTAKKMFGCPCYLVGKTIFGLLVDGGVVLTRLSPEQRSHLVSLQGGRPFVANGRTMKTWLIVPIGPNTIATGLQWLRHSYEQAGKDAGEDASRSSRKP